LIKVFFNHIVQGLNRFQVKFLGNVFLFLS
jgi:hypothetical protein